MNFLLLIGAGAAIILLAVLIPKMIFGYVPVDGFHRATYSSGTESGLTENSGDEQIGAYSGLVISEIMPANSSAVTDENGNFPDWVEIWNSTDHPISLE